MAATIISILALCVSLSIAVVNVLMFRAQRPRVRVEASQATVLFPEQSRACIGVRATNAGRPVRITDWGFFGEGYHAGRSYGWSDGTPEPWIIGPEEPPGTWWLDYHEQYARLRCQRQPNLDPLSANES